MICLCYDRTRGDDHEQATLYAVRAKDGEILCCDDQGGRVEFEDLPALVREDVVRKLNKENRE